MGQQFRVSYQETSCVGTIRGEITEGPIVLSCMVPTT